MRSKLLAIYHKLYNHFGPQHWWPADSAFEVIVGAILTQNTAWRNVERAMANLKEARCLSCSRMLLLNEKRLARLIKPAGYYNVKARRLKNFLFFLDKTYQGSLERMKKKDTTSLRVQLLSVSGIGPETADSILLYALEKPVFVVDAYTKRIYGRHKLIEDDAGYQVVQSLFMTHLPLDLGVFNEYHALIVRTAKEFCASRRPKCGECPLYEKKS